MNVNETLPKDCFSPKCCQISASEAAQSTENKAEGRVTKMVMVMIFFFLFAWTPYSVFALYVVFGRTHSVSPIVATLPPFFAKSCTIYNPVLYFVLNRQVNMIV